MTTSFNDLQKLKIWPSLVYSEWKNTLDTLHMWVQIVGKVKLALCPFLNQWWEIAFYVTSTGLTTGLIPYKNKAFEVEFDFIHHNMVVRASNGIKRIILLRPYSVSEFYKEFMTTLKKLNIEVNIYTMPVEFLNPINFKDDNIHASYDKAYVENWWQIQLQTSFIFNRFRGAFRGKSSPVQFFWGSFDLNGTRFSGKTATPPNIKGYMGKIMKFAENEENFAYGFWPGDERFPYPAFYTYLYPAPKGYETIKTGPAIAYFNKKLSECILPYEDVRKAKNPEKEIINFLETTYKEYAKLADWDTKALAGSTPA